MPFTKENHFAVVESRVRKLSDVEAAYVAACIDCDGHIGVHKNRNSKEVKVGISNCDKDFLVSILCMVNGGRLTEHKIKHIRPTHRKQWLLDFRVREMKDLLPQLLPYLFIKKGRALAAIEQLSC